MKGRFLVLPAYLLRLYREKKITASDLILLSVISVLSLEDGFCYATNQFLAEETGLSKGGVANKLTKFKKLGLIEVEVLFDEKGQVKERKILVKFDVSPLKNDGGMHRVMNTPSSNDEVDNIDDNKEVIPKNRNKDEKSSEQFGNEEINFLLNELQNKFGYLPVSRGRLRWRAMNMVKLLHRNEKDRKWMDEDWKKNLKHFLETVILVMTKKRIEPNYFETLYDWLKVWISKQGRELFGVESPWYLRWRREKEIEQTKRLTGKEAKKILKELDGKLGGRISEMFDKMKER